MKKHRANQTCFIDTILFEFIFGYCSLSVAVGAFACIEVIAVIVDEVNLFEAGAGGAGHFRGLDVPGNIITIATNAFSSFTCGFASGFAADNLLQ